MGAAVIFNGNSVKALKNSLILGTAATIFSGSVNPTITATSGTIGDIYIETGTANLFQKIITSGTDTNWTRISNTSNGDIPETSFSPVNNQVSPADVTGLAFANASVRSFQAFVSVVINATTSLYEVFTLQGVQRGADWQLTVTGTGDISQFIFSITTTGQVQYTNGNYTGFTSSSLHFRAISLSI